MSYGFKVKAKHLNDLSVFLDSQLIDHYLWDPQQLQRGDSEIELEFDRQADRDEALAIYRRMFPEQNPSPCH